jgi:hypothetical protein
MSNQNGTKQASMSFMDMSAEIRNAIYKLVLSPYSSTETYETIIAFQGNSKLMVLGRGHGQLCRVNRQIYNETIHLLYGQTFVFLAREAMTRFFSSRGERQLSQLRTIHMTVRSTDWSPAISSLLLPPEATLIVDWPIEKNLWMALGANRSIKASEVYLKRNGPSNIKDSFQARWVGDTYCIYGGSLVFKIVLFRTNDLRLSYTQLTKAIMKFVRGNKEEMRLLEI